MNSTKIDRGLLIKQPYASQIVRGELPIIFRKNSTSARGKVVVISTQAPDEKVFPKGTEIPIEKYPLGMAVGTVEISDSVETTKQKIIAGEFKELSRDYIKKYPWHTASEGKVFAWILKNPEEWIPPRKVKKPRAAQIWVKNFTVE